MDSIDIRELNKKDKYFDIWLMYPLNKDTMLMEINTVNWENDNYIDVLAKLRPEDKGLAFIDKYMKLRRLRKVNHLITCLITLIDNCLIL